MQGGSHSRLRAAAGRLLLKSTQARSAAQAMGQLLGEPSSAPACLACLTQQLDSVAAVPATQVGSLHGVQDAAWSCPMQR